jgi:hypothetical protein
MEAKRSRQMSYMNGVSMLDEMLVTASQEVPDSAFDLPENKPGMKPQHHDGPVRIDNKVDGKVVKSPEDS